MHTWLKENEPQLALEEDTLATVLFLREMLLAERQEKQVGRGAGSSAAETRTLVRSGRAWLELCMDTKTRLVFEGPALTFHPLTSRTP